MVNCERFVTEPLADLNEVLTSSTDQLRDYEIQLFRALVMELQSYLEDLRRGAEALAQLDLLLSFAWNAVEQDFCRPSTTLASKLELLGARHPVVEKHVGRDQFVANDIIMSRSRQHLLITGPNMGGKSTIMRQVAIAAILHQIGSFLPARKATLPIFDRIFTRVGASDDLSRGHSTFMVEMIESAQILREATSNSLVILDEVGRGTSTEDGLAIASAILLDLANRIGCYSLFATHYHELIEVAEPLPTVVCMQTEVINEAGQITFTHRLVDGAAGSSFGLEVAQLAGLPNHVIDVARSRLELGNQTLPNLRSDGPQSRSHSPTRPSSNSQKLRNAEQQADRQKHDLFTTELPGSSAIAPEESNGLLREVSQTNSREREVIDQVLAINPDRLTPLKALNLINTFKKNLCESQQGHLFE